MKDKLGDMLKYGCIESKDFKFEVTFDKFNIATVSTIKYDSPICIKENNTEKILVYNAVGIGEQNIEVTEEFINKSKEFYLNVNGSIVSNYSGYKNEISIHLLIDQKIYDGYNIYFENGLVIITLREIVNECPNIKKLN